MKGHAIEPSAAVLHELRTPLGYLVVAARAAAGECDADTPVFRHVQTLERAAMRLLASAEQVLAVALARQDYADCPFDPYLTTQQVLSDAVELGQPVVITVEHLQNWTTERGNPAQLEALIQSLLNNALQHGVRHGSVDVRLASREQVFELEVSNRVRAESHAGLGIGSNIASEMAYRLGGTIERRLVDGVHIARFILSRTAAVTKVASARGIA